MEIVISDERTIERLNQLADQLKQTPEEIVADAIARFEPTPRENDKAFWAAIRGIGESGDPDLAHNTKDILRQETDPIDGWGKPHDTEDSH